ncbi:protein-L-isoaspartate carboxylmethyltransferase [Microbacterium hominis]|uniref:Protein-L-isoaspartate carboxylmethyltransferase n=1 Tax=Microbacterium hominis TaxID=162426 RepID=A0A7D4QK30_9MICO|nr:protein-L-isoaspartate carboxylmethyltransferase [Microbacterium hominis]QKJ20196.1 protein-L-isoaspartate carboxylmethyltransferase [Microbacterium hominis]
MPYRDHATVQSWVTDFIELHGSVAPDVSVLEQYYTEGPDTGLVVIGLRTASTGTFVQPLERDGKPVWTVHFEPREEGLDLGAGAVAQLAADLQLLSELCSYLQERTDAAVAVA